jgi:hypothetical protein
MSISGLSSCCGIVGDSGQNLSSPGLTGRPSIPEAVVVKRKGRGVLDRPVKPGDDDSLRGELRAELRSKRNAR